MENIGLHNYEAFLLDYLEGNLSEAGTAELKRFALAHPELEIDLDAGDLPFIERGEITLDNKEQFKKTEADLQNEALLEYLEGHLPEAQRQAIEDKLLKNKDLAAELELLKKTRLRADLQDVVSHKSGWYKTEEDLLLNNRGIAYYENQLPDSEKETFEQELNISKALQDELALLRKTRLIADAQLVYPNKEALKRRGRIIALFNTRSVMRVAAAMLLLLTLSVVAVYYTKPGAIPQPALAHTPAVQPANTHTIVPQQTRPALNAPEHKAPQHGLANATQPESKTGTVTQLQATTNPVAQQPQTEARGELQPPVQKQAQIPENTLATTGNNVVNQSVPKTDSSFSEMPGEHMHALAVLEEAYDDESEASAAPQKKGFWKRAVKLARQVNNLGVKAVDGTESSNRYSLSFNSFSVEKH